MMIVSTHTHNVRGPGYTRGHGTTSVLWTTDIVRMLSTEVVGYGGVVKFKVRPVKGFGRSFDVNIQGRPFSSKKKCNSYQSYYSFSHVQFHHDMYLKKCLCVHKPVGHLLMVLSCCKF